LTREKSMALSAHGPHRPVRLPLRPIEGPRTRRACAATARSPDKRKAPKGATADRGSTGHEITGSSFRLSDSFRSLRLV
jgi:hypothetical protein